MKDYTNTYLHRLLNGAILNNIDNGTFGNYRISSQHGKDIFVFSVYKNEEHISSINIGKYDKTVNLEIKSSLSVKETTTILDFIHETYFDFDINTKTM